MDINNFIQHDDFLDIDYIDYQDYLDNKELLNDLQNLPQLLVNGTLNCELYSIKKNLNTVTSWYYWLLYSNNYKERVSFYEKLKAICEIETVFLDNSSEYNRSKNKEGIWKYINKTMDDLYNYLDNDSVQNIPLSELCDYSYFINLKKEFLGEENIND